MLTATLIRPTAVAASRHLTMHVVPLKAMYSTTTSTNSESQLDDEGTRERAPRPGRTLASLDEQPKDRKHDLFTQSNTFYLAKEGWGHVPFSMEEMKSVGVAHHVPKTMSDRVARRTLLFVRKTFDWVTGYKHPPPGEEANPKYKISTEKWLQRFIFLESVAGVPGMVGGMVRHLHSLRLLRRDRAWIETLLEEAYNERMHLLTFINMAEPGLFMRALLLGAQGVFFNCFFVAYLISPRTCHRFVGYLEEEAVTTYTRCIDDIERGWYPEWETQKAPAIAIQYWNMPKDATVKQLLYYVRADECKHREVNHTFGNLKQTIDRNPYALTVDNGTEQPRKDLQNHNKHPVGWERKDIAA